MWEFLHSDRWIVPKLSPRGRRHIVVALRRAPKHVAMLPQIVATANGGSGIDLISRALGIGATAVRDTLHFHRTGKRPPGMVTGHRRHRRQPGQPFGPKCW